jgi:hypothetical protein
MKFILTSPVKYWPSGSSPLHRVADAGTPVILIRRESATLYLVRLEDAKDPADTILVAASEIEAA